MTLLLRVINATRLAWFVFAWLMRDDKPDSAFKVSLRHPRYLTESAVVLIGRGREAWRISHFAVEVFEPKEAPHDAIDAGR